MSRDCDVLVVGAGPAGCAAAITLARRGLHVQVLDRARFPRDKTCGDALSESAVDELRTLGALPLVTEGPHLWLYERAAILPDGTRVTRRSSTPGMMVPRKHLDDALRRGAAAAGAVVREGVCVRGLRGGADGARAETDEGPLSARVAIAADGPGSVGHAAVGHPKPRGRLLAVSATAYMQHVAMPPGPPVAEHYFTHALPAGYAWVFPAVGDYFNVGVYQRADAYHRRQVPLSTLLGDFIAGLPQRFEGAQRVGRTRSWPLPLCGPGVGPIAGEGVLLAGDAAGLVDPLSGEGIWQALFSGRHAAEVAAEACARGVLDAALRRRYWLRCGLRIAALSRSRAAIQAAMDRLVSHRLYRHRAVRALLQAGYGAASPT